MVGFMQFLKNHIGVIFPLLVLLFAIEFSTMVGRIVVNYEKGMGKDYNIIVVANSPLKDSELKNKIETFKEAVLLDTKSVLDRLKNDVSAKNLSLLENSLPKFYSIKLTDFPSSSYMKRIERTLLDIDGVKKVETFSKTHDKIYKLLVIFKDISQYFTILIALMGIVLIFKQMRIWLYEHKQRIEIMTYLGAPYWLKSAMLYKIAVIDSIIATFFVVIFYSILSNINFFENTAFSIGLSMPEMKLFADSFVLFTSSIIVSIISVSLVMMKTREHS